MAKSFNFTFAFAAYTGAFLLSFMSLEVLSDISTNSNVSRYTFSWLYTDDDKMKPRGGTTVGAPLRLSSAPSSHWTQLQAPNLTKKEKDRKAILAMQGPYRASFDFLESVGYLGDYVPPRPYQSWGTEYVYVVNEEEDFISLQHILVMFMQDEEDKIKGPFVIKHWRQDWKYENRLLVEYKGQDTWLPRQLGKKEAEGTWTQAVFRSMTPLDMRVLGIGNMRVVCRLGKACKPGDLCPEESSASVTTTTPWLAPIATQ